MRKASIQGTIACKLLKCCIFSYYSTLSQAFAVTQYAVTEHDFYLTLTRVGLWISKKYVSRKFRPSYPVDVYPRSVEIIVRAEAVERAQAGDRCDFTGTLIVVPDVASLNLPGARAESSSRHAGGRDENEGVSGL